MHCLIIIRLTQCLDNDITEFNIIIGTCQYWNDVLENILRGYDHLMKKSDNKVRVK